MGTFSVSAVSITRREKAMPVPGLTELTILFALLIAFVGAALR